MSTRMVILGLLRDRPLYGYEIKSIIVDHMGDWADIAFGSIYYALNKLAENGSIIAVATEQDGGRPARTVYQITERGRETFLRLLRETWQTSKRPAYAQDLAMFFLDALPADEVAGYLRGQREGLRHTLDLLNAHHQETMSSPQVPPVARAIFDHGRYHLEAELRWTEDVLKALEEGEFTTH